MANTKRLTSPAQPPDPPGLTLVSFTATSPVLDRGDVLTALAEADRQLAVLPWGRVLKGLDNSKLARRMSTVAARAGLRPRLMTLLNTVVHLLVHYSKLVDEIPLRQLVAEAGLGPSAARKVGTDLVELSVAGLLLYRPGRGRGRGSVLGIPPRFASDVLLRLQREGTWCPPAPDDVSASGADNVGSTPGVSTGGEGVVGERNDDHLVVGSGTDNAGQRSDNAPDNSPGGGGVFDVAPLSYVPKEPSPPLAPSAANTASSTHTRGAATPSNSGTESGDNASRVDPADVDWILARLPASLRTAAGSRGRRHQASAIRAALAEEFARGEILRRITDRLPEVIDTASGYVAYRLMRLKACAESPRSRRQRLEAQQARDRDQTKLSVDEQQACRRRQADLHANVPPAVLAALAEVAVSRLTVGSKQAYLTANALAAEISLMLRDVSAEGSEPSVSTLGGVLDVALRALAGGGRQPRDLDADTVAAVSAAPTLVAAVAALRPGELIGPAPVRGRSGEAEDHVVQSPAGAQACVACGTEDATVTARPELPQGSLVCQVCYLAAIEEDFVVASPREADREDEGSEPSGWGAGPPVRVGVEVVDEMDLIAEAVA